MTHSSNFLTPFYSPLFPSSPSPRSPMESSPPTTPAGATAAAAVAEVAASSSQSKDKSLLVGFDLPAAWGYRKHLAFYRPPDSSPVAAGVEPQANSSRSLMEGAASAAVAEECPRGKGYPLRDRRVSRDRVEDARENLYAKLWNKDGGASRSVDGSKFSLELTKQEIMEDFIKMTGRKPPRRAKRRSKNVQHQINALSLGESLSEVNHDRYKVNENGGF